MPLQLRSQVNALGDGTGELELSLVEVPLPEPGAADEIVVRIEAAPLNPSDMGLLFGGADMSQARVGGSATQPRLNAPIAAPVLKALAGRVGQSLAVGNEGAGTVVAAGSAPQAQALLGRKVAVIGGDMFGEYRAVPVGQSLLLPDGASAIDGASSFVNPLTALGMVETLRSEGHRALVHTAAASNLGQMLNRVCIEDGIELVNVVRRPEQAALLRAQGARHVVDSSAVDFPAQLLEAIAATGATLAFDAVSGGPLAGQLLRAMEQALQQRPGAEYSRYGSATHKQVYLYGVLDRGPIELQQGIGMSWGVGGWLLFPFMQRIGDARLQQLKQRVAAGLHGTFASHYSQQLSLAEVLSPAAIARYRKLTTGEKVVVLPSAG